jgi:hypothetical protein
VQAGALDLHHVHVILAHDDPECPDRRDRRFRVRRPAEAADGRVPLADRAQEQRSVGDRLVARHRDVTHNRRSGLDLHRSPSTGETTTP